MWKKHIILLLLVFLLTPETYAGNPHVMWGYCHDGHDGTIAVEATVFMYIEEKENETLTTTVGNNHAYNIDASGFLSGWNIGDVVIVKIEKGKCSADKKIVLNGAGAQRIPDLALTCPEPSDNESDSYKPSVGGGSDGYKPSVTYVDNSTIPSSQPMNTSHSGPSNVSTPSPMNESVGGLKEENNSTNITGKIAGKIENGTYQNTSELKKTQQKDQQKKDEEQGNYLWILGVIIIIIAVILILFFVFINKKHDKKEKISESRALPKLADEEVKVLKAVISDALTEKELSQKIGHSVSYTTEKLSNYGILYFDDEGKAYINDWAKPKFIYEYVLDKEQKNIVMLLKKESELTQIEITKKTGIARATVARRLDKLEELDVIKRYVVGSSKKVKLLEWFMRNL